MAQVILLAVITAIFWGTSPLFEKAALRTAAPLTGLAVRSFATAIAMAILLLTAGARVELSSATRREIALFATGGLLAGFIGQLIYFYALKIGQASIVVPVIAGLYPLVAALWGVLFLKEPVTTAKVIGASLIISGVVIIRLHLG